MITADRALNELETDGTLLVLLLDTGVLVNLMFFLKPTALITITRFDICQSPCTLLNPPNSTFLTAPFSILCITEFLIRPVIYRTYLRVYYVISVTYILKDFIHSNQYQKYKVTSFTRFTLILFSSTVAGFMIRNQT